MSRIQNTSLRTHYDVLSVNEDAVYDEIRQSYRAAILRSHPDKLCGSSFSNLSFSDSKNEAFLSAQKAWEVLSDPQSRETYDNYLRISRNQMEVVDGEIRMEDMMVMRVGGDVWELSYQCRCGDYFSISLVELEEMGVSVEGSGSRFGVVNGLGEASMVVLSCGSCSLKIRLVIDSDSSAGC